MTSEARAAYVELNYFHGEIMPSFAKIAAAAGVELDFYVLRQNLESDPFGTLLSGKSVTPIDLPDPHNPCAHTDELSAMLRASGYDFIILGTVEPRDRVDFALALALPALIVAHNAQGTLPTLDEATWAVLTPAAAARQHDHDPVLIQPLYCGDVEAHASDRDAAFAVVGNVQYQRRNYGALLRALSGLRHDGVSPEECTIRIIGRWNADMAPPGVEIPLDGARLISDAERLGVRDFLDFPDRPLDHDSIRSRLGRCRYALPLIDNFYAPTRRYVKGKACSGVNQAIGALVIPILNDKYAASLGLSTGHRYHLDGVEAGLRAALNADDDARLHSLARYRDDALEQSAQRLRQWVERL